VKGCKILAYARHSRRLSREGSLSCHTWCDTVPRFFRSHPNDQRILSPLTTLEGVWSIFFLYSAYLILHEYYRTVAQAWCNNMVQICTGARQNWLMVLLLLFCRKS
jgi:hypothetical protein